MVLVSAPRKVERALLRALFLANGFRFAKKTDLRERRRLPPGQSPAGAADPPSPIGPFVSEKAGFGLGYTRFSRN
jgi:hypothetical protein